MGRAKRWETPEMTNETWLGSAPGGTWHSTMARSEKSVLVQRSRWRARLLALFTPGGSAGLAGSPTPHSPTFRDPPYTSFYSTPCYTLLHTTTSTLYPH